LPLKTNALVVLVASQHEGAMDFFSPINLEIVRNAAIPTSAPPFSQ
jgi:hypothetical protein